MRHVQISGLVCLLVLVVLNVSLVGIPSCSLADDNGQPGPYMSVWVNNDRPETFQRLTIHASSKIWTRNYSGDLVLDWSNHEVNITLYDIDNDVVIENVTMRLFVGNVTFSIYVKEYWTTSQVNISVIDYEAGLYGYVNVYTQMSDRYMVYLFESKWIAGFSQYQNEVDAKANARISTERTFMGLMFGTLIFTFVVIILRVDHRRSRRVRWPSIWDLMVEKIFPFGLNDDDWKIWIGEGGADVETWDDATAKHYQDTKRIGHLERLHEQKTDIEREIELVEKGWVET